MKITLLVCQDRVSQGCAIKEGLVKKNWIDKYCAPRRLRRNLPMVPSHFLRLGNKPSTVANQGSRIGHGRFLTSSNEDRAY